MSASPELGSQTPDKRQELLSTLRKEYDLADALAKEVQAFVDEAGIPAINELRYAGYHLLYADTGSGEAEEAQLTKAINHCRRASYEAAEAGVLTALDRIKQFKEDYRLVVISEVVDGWTAILKDADEVLAKLTASRAKGDSRHEDYETHMAGFRLMAGHCSLCSHSRDDLNKKIREAQTAGRQFTVNTLLAVLGIVVAIILGVVVLPKIADFSGAPPVDTPPSASSVASDESSLVSQPPA